MSDPVPERSVPVIGLLGGIAAGKSAVAGAFAEHGYEVLDADAVARRVLTRPDRIAALTARFGPAVLGPDGAIDRSALARAAFADTTARRDLEAITHPPVRAELLERLAAARQAGRPVVLDVPLLLEGGLIASCDATVFVDTPLRIRLARASARGWEPGELERREAHQADLKTKRARSDFVVDNGGDPAATRAAVAAIATTLARRGGDAT